MTIQKNISLKDYTNFQIGGPARFFCEPKNTEKIINALEFAQEKNLPIFILGLGANILVSDKGFPGLIIRPQNKKISIRNNIIFAQAGATIDKVIDLALKNNLIGFEDFSGIPSTIGGALFINLHYFDAFIGNFLKSALVLNKNTLKTEKIKPAWFKFGYDDSKLKTDKNYILLQAEFKLKKVNNFKKHEAIGKAKEIIRTRERRYPQEPSVGSIFQNPSNAPAAYLIDKCGLKGKKIGDALLSPKHANMIVNTGNAKASDILKLTELIKQKVKKKFKTHLKLEMELVGF